MVPIEMPMDARMHLAKMSFIYEQNGEGRIKISKDEDVIKLINYAAASINNELLKYLDAFISTLSRNELRELAAQGANVYRGALVPPAEENPAPAEHHGVKTYRGVALAPEEPPKPAQPVAKTAPPAKKKPKRMYRGRVIED